MFHATTVFLIFHGPQDEARSQKFVKILSEIKWDLDDISIYLVGMYSVFKEILSACIINECAQVSK